MTLFSGMLTEAWNFLHPHSNSGQSGQEFCWRVIDLIYLL